MTLLPIEYHFDLNVKFLADTLKDWCDPNPILKVVRRIINQPNDMFVTRENALEIVHRWESTFNSECTFAVEAERGSGLIMNINQIQFRKEPSDPFKECTDYFRLKFRNGTKTRKMCGHANATSTVVDGPLGGRSFVVPDGKVEIKIKIGEFPRLRHREFLYVDFLFTQFESGE